MSPEAYSQLEALLRLFLEHGLAELIVEEGSFKLYLGTDRTNPPSLSSSAMKSAPDRAAQRPERATRTVAIRSPLIGIFYRAPTPDAPPFVEIGDMVDEGETVCVVEAMKVFNEIKAEWSGRVIAIPVENGKLVQAGEPLVVLEFPREPVAPREGA